MKSKKRTRFRNLVFKYQDIADAKGVTVHAVRQAVKRGRLDPTDLKSIAEYILKIDGIYS